MKITHGESSQAGDKKKIGGYINSISSSLDPRGVAAHPSNSLSDARTPTNQQANNKPHNQTGFIYTSLHHAKANQRHKDGEPARVSRRRFSTGPQEKKKIYMFVHSISKKQIKNEKKTFFR
jgi:hypothetical protein